jgi:hypothetical protein
MSLDSCKAKLINRLLVDFECWQMTSGFLSASMEQRHLSFSLEGEITVKDKAELVANFNLDNLE